jgi:hypothetical protein
LIFGGAGAGEGISSCRGTGCFDYRGDSLQYTLDFYTNYTNQMAVANGLVFVYGDTWVQGCMYYGNGSGNLGTCVSDERLKSNIKPFPRLLDKLVQLQPVHFDWNASAPPELYRSSTRQTGFLAQDVEKIFPDMVTMGKDGYRRVDYGQFPYLLLQGVRELKGSNDKLQAEAQLQRKQNEQAHAEIAKLRKSVAATQAWVARLDRASVAKDLQIARMSQQIEELRKAQEQIAVLLTRVAPPEGRGEKQSAEVRPTVETRPAQQHD